MNHKYFLQRILIAIPTVIAISIVIFTILAIAPGDPMGEFATNPSITAEVRENIRKSLGLDQPIYIRYVKWAWAFLKGDMGYSFTSRSPVSGLIIQRLPNTLWVVGTAYILALILAFTLGIMAATKRNSWIDQLTSTIGLIGFSLPPFFTGLVLIIIFSVNLNWLPFVYDSNIQVNSWDTFLQQFRQSLMPVMVLTLYQTPVLMRFIRAAIIEEIPQDYVRTAYAKGLSYISILKNHILRNALIPVVTLIALDIPGIFTGALVTEQIFRVPGIGSLLIESINRSDTPVVMAITFIYGILVVTLNLIADLIYGILDPRVRYN